MSTPQNFEQRPQEPVANPATQAPLPPLPNSSPPRSDVPLMHSAPSDSEQMSHEQASDVLRLSGRTNATTAITSAPPDKSEQYSLFDHPRLNASRIPSANGHENGDVGRYPSIMRPMPVMSVDSAAHNASRMASGIEWIVPTSTSAAERRPREKTVGERLQPTMDVAVRERDSYTRRARYYGLALNSAIGLQVVIGAITTGVAAATTGRSTSIGISVLGGMSTMLASFLAKSRGSNEPENSNLRSRELDTFIREAEAWRMDKGHLIGSEYDAQINKFRERFEDIIRTAGEDTNTTGFDSQHPRSQGGPNHYPSNVPNNPKAMEKV